MAATPKDAPFEIQSKASRARALHSLSLAEQPVTRERTWYSVTKRALDLVGAALLLLLLSPVMLAISLVIKATSPGPAILTQERTGKGGKTFAFYKYRSMYNNCDQTAARRFAKDYINGSLPSKVPRDGVFKAANDRRITTVGKYLRRTSLDELPQLFNVVKGDMSLVGPRPSMPYEVDLYKPWHFKRLEALPGMTGLAQIRGRSSLTFAEIVRIDIEYVRRCSLALDIQILLKTLPVVLSTRGAR